ncbi:MAG TPA: hypothetical protein VLE89_08980 [Chlamydiales bacterium]|nr:hypothetical protein [Chlamydiales bacterium]
MIALSLTAVLLTFLFSFFVESAKIEKRLETARVEISSRQYLQMRLQSIFSNIDRASFQAPLYTQLFPEEKNASLVATFDNGIDPDPIFSGTVLGRIYLDEKKQLVLATWPIDKDRSWRKEILLSNVSNYEFEFLAQKTEEKGAKKRTINSTLEWRSNWPIARLETPSVIRLLVWKEKKDPVRFAFILPSPEPMITYWEGGRRS